VTVTEDKNYNYGKLASADNWDLICLVDSEYLKSRVVSYLIIQDNEFFYQLCTTAFEIYSAYAADDPIAKRVNSTTLLVSLQDDTYIDESKDGLCVSSGISYVELSFG
jgi:hypothetical protein